MVPTKLFFVITNKTSVIRTPFIRTLGYKNTPSMVPRGTFIGYKNTSAIRTPLRNVNGYKNTLSAERTVNKNVLHVVFTSYSVCIYQLPSLSILLFVYFILNCHLCTCLLICLLLFFSSCVSV